MPWRLVIAPSALRDLRRLPDRDADAVREALDRAALNPSSVDLKKLGGRSSSWRMRIGRWRAIAEFDNAAGVITVASFAAAHYLLPRAPDRADRAVEWRWDCGSVGAVRRRARYGDAPVTGVT